MLVPEAYYENLLGSGNTGTIMLYQRKRVFYKEPCHTQLTSDIKICIAKFCTQCTYNRRPWKSEIKNSENPKDFLSSITSENH